MQQERAKGGRFAACQSIEYDWSRIAGMQRSEFAAVATLKQVCSCHTTNILARCRQEPGLHLVDSTSLIFWSMAEPITLYLSHHAVLMHQTKVHRFVHPTGVLRTAMREVEISTHLHARAAHK
jgi:hypothetical protein